MRELRYAAVYPMDQGLDKQSIPGTQAPAALKQSVNNIITPTGSLKKAPGVERLDYVGKDDGIQAAIHFFARTGSGQGSEIVRVRKGRVEVIRSSGNVEDLGLSVSPTDAVVFSRFGNKLIIHFENTAPKTYTLGATSLSDLGIFSSHQNSPPTFSRVHDFRLWYGGRGAAPHRLIVSAINDIEDYTLASGGFAMRVNDGDGDPVGVTGISPAFRGDIYVTKWNSIHRITLGNYGYQRVTVSEEVGCVHHNTMVATQNDIFFVSVDGIHSLVTTDSYGAVMENTITYPIYEYFQEIVNWSKYQSMVATYDKPSNSYLLSFASSGSTVHDKVLGFNTQSKKFFEWDSVCYPVLTKYYDYGRQKTLVGDDVNGMGVLDAQYNTRFGKAYSFQARTGVIFPMNVPKSEINFIKMFVCARPTAFSNPFKTRYWINGNLVDSIDMDTEQNGVDFEGTATEDIGELIIGQGIIGDDHRDMIIIEGEMKGKGNSVQFEFTQDPTDSDPNKPLEIFGVVYEYSYNEDSEKTQEI